MTDNVIKTNTNDNVVIARRAIVRGEDVVLNGEILCVAGDDVPAAHKIAIDTIESGRCVVRYGENIVEATTRIEPGRWVHVHNTRPIPEHRVGER